jgi:hypothetical protein
MAVAHPLLVRQRIFAAKSETTNGTAESLTASDAALNIFEPKLDADSELSERQGQSALSPLPGVAGAIGADVEATTDLVGSDTVPSWGVLLQAAGFGLDTRTYTIKTGVSTQATLTCGLYTDGRLKTAAGCMFDMVIKLKAGEPGRVEFKGRGAWQAPTDVALITPTYPTTKPPRFAGVAFTVGGTAYLVDEVEIALGNEVVLRQDPAASCGYRSAVITNRKVTVKMAPEAKLLAAQDWHAAYLAGTTYALSCPVGTAADNIVTITAPALQLLKPPADDDRDGVLVEALEFQSCRDASAGDDELVIAFS